MVSNNNKKYTNKLLTNLPKDLEYLKNIFKKLSLGKEELVQRLLLAWNRVGAWTYNPETTSYNTTSNTLHNLFAKPLFGSSETKDKTLAKRVFTPLEFIIATARLQTLMDSGSTPLEHKEKIRETSLPFFLYDPRDKQSLFLTLLDDHTIPLSEITLNVVANIVEENIEVYAKVLLDKYVKTILGGIEYTPSPADHDCFVEAGTKIQKLFKDNKHRILSGQYIPPICMQVEWFWDSLLFFTEDPFTIRPRWFRGTKVYIDFAAFLTKNRILGDKASRSPVGRSIYDSMFSEIRTAKDILGDSIDDDIKVPEEVRHML